MARKLSDVERLEAISSLRKRLESAIEQTPKGITDSLIIGLVADILGYRMPKRL